MAESCEQGKAIHGLRHECATILDILEGTREKLVEVIGDRPVEEIEKEVEPGCLLDSLDNSLATIKARALYNAVLVRDVVVRL